MNIAVRSVIYRYIFLTVFSLILHTAYSQKKANSVSVITVANGWANNSVNVAVFRKNSIVTHAGIQYIAFYDENRFVVLGKRTPGSKQWQLKKTPYQGNVSDAHNIISIMVDGNGYLHMSWDHHNNPLRYCRSVSPGSLELTEKLPMTGMSEQKVSYPEFYKMPGGNLLFIYRDGQSGQGNIVINQYDIHTTQWTQLHANLIDGEGTRNAYWQACVDQKGTIHISWVWRETPDVASNHDLCYARSVDGGKTWEKSTGDKYSLPVNAARAEYICRIPQNSELINQTSMFADREGHPYIATYWREQGSTIPQYHLVYKNGTEWKTQDLGFRKSSFTLSGAGSKHIPVSRPQIIAWQKSGVLSAAIIFRDEERGNKVSIARSADLTAGKWTVRDITQQSLGSWEPTYDTELWKEKGILHIFIQRVEQVDAEGLANIPPQPVQVVEYKLR